MSRLDDELREALKRVDPGPDFTRQVLARAAALPPKRSWMSTLRAAFRSPLRMATAGAVACTLLVSSSLYYRHHRETVARDQLLLALRITGAKLHAVQAKVNARNE